MTARLSLFAACLPATFAIVGMASVADATSVGAWGSGSGQGYVEYDSTTGSSFITISCDVAASLDHSGTGISLEIDGRLLPANSRVEFDVDGEIVAFPSDISGGVSVGRCPECQESFRTLWRLLREGRKVDVVASDGRRATFSLSGSSRILPVEPCPAGSDTDHVLPQSSNVDPAGGGNASPMPAAVPQTESGVKTGDDAAAPVGLEAMTTAPVSDIEATCADLPPADTLTVPLHLRDATLAPPPDQEAGFVFTYTNGNDLVRARPSDKAAFYGTYGGDDLIYIEAPEIPGWIESGAGADTIVVCSLEANLSIMVGRTDVATDVVIVDAGAFRMAPNGAVLKIGGMASQTDKVFLHIPEGMEADVRLSDNGAAYLVSAGELTVEVEAARVWSPFFGRLLTIVAADGTRQNVADVPPSSIPVIPTQVAESATVGAGLVTLGGETTTDVTIPACPDAPAASTPVPTPIPVMGGVSYSALETDDPRRTMMTYGADDDTIAAAGDGFEFAVDGGAGNDQIYVFSPHTMSQIDGGTGADLIVLCSAAADGVSLAVNFSGGSPGDADPDTLVVGPEMLERIPDGFYRHIRVNNFTSANDRVVLRFPAGTQVGYQINSSGTVDLLIGRLFIELFRTEDYHDQPFNHDSVVLVSPEFRPTSMAVADVLPDALPQWRYGPARSYDGSPAEMTSLPASCTELADPDYPGGLAAPVPLPDTFGAMLPGLAAYSRGDDLIRLLGVRETTSVEASSGNDRIYLIDVGDNVDVSGGPGADLIVLCSMRGAVIHLRAGRGMHPVDRFPDVVVIEPSVFETAPDGVGRQIWLQGLLSVNDRLELRLPPGVDLETVRNVDGAPEEMRAGNVTLFLNSGSGYHTEPLGFNASSIVVVAGERQ